MKVEKQAWQTEMRREMVENDGEKEIIDLNDFEFIEPEQHFISDGFSQLGADDRMESGCRFCNALDLFGEAVCLWNGQEV